MYQILPVTPIVGMFVEGWAGTEIPSGARLVNGVGTAGAKKECFCHSQLLDK